MSNGRSRTNSSFNCLSIALQRSSNGICAIQRSSVIGLASSRSLNRQRQGVVNVDHIATGSYRYGKVIGACSINRKAFALILSNRLCSVLAANDFLRSHILRDLGRGALQIMMYSDRSLIQLKVRIVGMCHIQTIFFGRCVMLILADRFSTVINSPVIKYIGCRCCRCSGACCRAGIDLHGLACRINSSHVSAVRCDRIINGNFFLFPNGEQVFVRLFFISRYLSRRMAIYIRIPGSGPYQEVCSRAALGLGPSLELITVTSLSAKDIYRLIDLDSGVGVIQSSLSIIFRTVVAVPVDVSGGLLFLVLVYSLQLDGVVVMMIIVINNICLSYNSTCRGVGDLCIVLQCRESTARGNSNICIDISGSVPGLQYPVVKEFPGRSSRCSTGAHT